MTGTMRPDPRQRGLNQLALATASRCGVDVDAVAGDVVNTSPINGEPLADAQLGRRLRRRRHASPGHRRPSCSGARFRPRPEARWSSGWASCSPCTRTTSPP